MKHCLHAELLGIFQLEADRIISFLGSEVAQIGSYCRRSTAYSTLTLQILSTQSSNRDV